jgi:hypothetical protein
MSRVQAQTFVRSGEGFLPVSEVARYDGDCYYVPGALSLIIDGAEMLGTDLWDDVNWLWPLVVQALDECRRTGFGRRGFPDQPISFKAELAWAGNVLVTVTDGESIDRSAVAPADELYQVVAREGVQFFNELQRLCPGNEDGLEERGLLASWLAPGE